jgi:AraC-like DNA-binding protein
LDLRERAMGLRRTEVPKAMDVAVATRSRSGVARGGDAVGSETFSPFWLVSSMVEREEASALSHKVLGHGVAREAVGAGLSLPFDARCVLTTRPDIGLMSCFSPAPRWSWPQGGAALRGGAGLQKAPRHVLVRPADGRVAIEQAGRRIVLRAREAAVICVGCETLFSLVEIGRIDLIALDATRLPALDDAHDSGLMQAMPRGNRGLQVLAHYGALLMRGLLPLNSAGLQSLAIGHIHDLVGIMLAERDLPASMPAIDRRSGRLAAIKADVEARLERRDLSIDMIAALHGVSSRAIQKLFESERRTFSDYVLERRLERAWHRLVTIEGRGPTISTVAFEVGFGDLSYFNRSFRKRFGRSPSQVKAGAQPEPA